ncbi:MAG: hypothetical protein GX060_02310 [Firmicutes bacterium]|nr:hypothetical protein [Bacillota bacterium]
MVRKSYEEINAKIKRGEAVVITAEEVIELVETEGLKKATQQVDVVTTATFAPMCSSGAFLNFGHSDPPMRMTQVELNGVPAYAGIASVDAYIGATELGSSGELTYGGAHVIQDLVDGKTIRLKAKSYGTDCYPRTSLETDITLDKLNQAYLFNPRNVYQNYGAATNSSDRTLHTYMGRLRPKFGNVTYCSAGELSPLLNDPYLRTIGIGTRVFIGGAQGFVAWEGTQHNPSKPRSANGVPVGGAATLALIGDLKQMSSRFLRASVMPHYGVTLFLGVGIPIPILDEEMMRFVAVRNRDIWTEIYDYGVPRRERPSLGRVNYEQLRSGSITLQGRQVPTSSLSSLARARAIAQLLKEWVQAGEFALQPPVQQLPTDATPQILQTADKEDRAHATGLSQADAAAGLAGLSSTDRGI